MSSEPKSIDTSDLLRVFFRALLIQASWSYERMQSLGFAYAVEPALRKLYPDPAEYETRLRLHLEYFNTQPYLASFIVGAAIRMEQDRAAGTNTDCKVRGLKESLMAPLGALGDSFFWGSLKPFAVAVAAALCVTGSWWAPVLFLALYNAVHIGIRAGALFRGFRSGGDAVRLISDYRFIARARRFKAMSLAMLGGMIGLMPQWRAELKPALVQPGVALVAAGAVFTLLLVAVVRRAGSPIQLMLGLAAVCVALAYAGVL